MKTILETLSTLVLAVAPTPAPSQGRGASAAGTYDRRRPGHRVAARRAASAPSEPDSRPGALLV